MEKVEEKRLHGGHWLWNCYNGECDQLPELNGHDRKWVKKMWLAMCKDGRKNADKAL